MNREEQFREGCQKELEESAWGGRFNGLTRAGYKKSQAAAIANKDEKADQKATRKRRFGKPKK